jgi:pimeloyl-ACP methyl ester carboxylesterase
VTEVCAFCPQSKSMRLVPRRARWSGWAAASDPSASAAVRRLAREERVRVDVRAPVCAIAHDYGGGAPDCWGAPCYRNAMPLVSVGRGIELCYEEFGAGEPLVLIMGLGQQLVMWDEELCLRLARAGFRVIRFDNRDVGHSTRLDHEPAPPIGAVVRARLLGRPVSTPYTLHDMAADTLGLMDALGIASAHVVGLSLGGMIAQELSLAAPARVRSLALAMSSTGELWTLVPTPAGLRVLLRRARRPATREAALGHMVESWHMLGASPHRTPPERVRALGGTAFDRGGSPQGFARQLAAVLAAPARARQLRSLRIPTVVLHGARDPLVPAHGGRLLAARIPGARLHVIEGMGHDLGPSVWDFAIAAIVRNARRVLPPHAAPQGIMRAMLRRPLRLEGHAG